MILLTQVANTVKNSETKSNDGCQEQAAVWGIGMERQCSVGIVSDKDEKVQEIFCTTA